MTPVTWWNFDVDMTLKAAEASAPDGRKVRGTIHWVSKVHAKRVHVKLYDRLFQVADPASKKDAAFADLINPDSLVHVEDALIESEAASSEPGSRFQFERIGYFYLAATSQRQPNGRISSNRFIERFVG